MLKTEFIFTVPGAPEGKGRPKVNGRTMTVYTPKKTREYEAKVKKCLNEQIMDAALAEPEDEVTVVIKAHFPIPKSTPKKKRLQIVMDALRPCKKPDLDNIIKIIMDALNGVVYPDDKQVVRIWAEKDFALVADPCVEIEIAVYHR